MPGQTRITFRNFTGLDLSSARRVTPRRYKAPGFGEETLVRGALSALGGVSSIGGLLSGAAAAASSPPGSLTVSGIIPGVRIRVPAPDYTMAYGVTAGAGAGVAYGAGAGIYFWRKAAGGEVGLYGSLSVGVVSNIGVGAGGNFAFLFGPAPSMLAGDCITISVEIGIDVITVAGQLILNAPPVSLGMPPAITGAWSPEVIGIGYAVTAGMSALPADISVMPGRTWTRAVASF
ncbi:hypothetical protein [Zavarzinia sp.]|uniref:hypothetical protein n=1 Tax=Zavarzinia sp. TaxID=2027920 RepID=UPI0035646F6B